MAKKFEHFTGPVEVNPYGIREGQTWKYRGPYRNTFGDIKILKVLQRSSLAHILVHDKLTDTCRTMNAYAVARTGFYELEIPGRKMWWDDEYLYSDNKVVDYAEYA